MCGKTYLKSPRALAFNLVSLTASLPCYLTQLTGPLLSRGLLTEDTLEKGPASTCQG